MPTKLGYLTALAESQAGGAMSPDEALAILDALPEKPTSAQVLEQMGRLREVLKDMNHLSREFVREGAVKKLRLLGYTCPTRLVDAAMSRPSRGGDEMQDSRVTGLEDPDLWPEAVEGSFLLNTLAETLSRFLALSPEQFAPLALWVLFAHAHDAFEISPILALTSPDKGCGKSTALALLSALVPRPLTSANITPSAVFRAADYYRPSLLLDEADTFLSDAEGLRGILNSGHMKRQAYVTRVVGDDHGVCTFSTWAPKSIAMIGDLPPTLADRSITIRMRRRARGEMIERLQLHRLAEMEDLRSMAARWASDHLEELRIAEPEIPDTILKDRARDNWRPLLAIADLAGGEWPARARASAIQLSALSKGDASASIHLLEDLRALFLSRGAERLSSEEILGHLHQMEERPWPEWRDRGKMTGRQLALLLLPFGIAPKKWKHEKVTVRGYDREDFRDAFSRYIPLDPPLSPPASSQRTYTHPPNATGGQKVAVHTEDKSNVFSGVAEVAVQKTANSREEVSQ